MFILDFPESSGKSKISYQDFNRDGRINPHSTGMIISIHFKHYHIPFGRFISCHNLLDQILIQDYSID
ncbi:MAG: hypothetical protein IJ677_08765 [Alphaproteobacteria bacterium]|nr:hypothetical protein [Alphaproteobacteria bacterium]